MQNKIFLKNSLDGTGPFCKATGTLNFFISHDTDRAAIY